MTNELKFTLAYFIRNKKKYFLFVVQITFCLIIINILFLVRNNYYVEPINILKNDIVNITRKIARDENYSKRYSKEYSNKTTNLRHLSKVYRGVRDERRNN